jgi:hypothetical protein
MTQHYNTTAAYISGGICGPIRWPYGAIAGRPLRKNLRGRWGILDRFTEPASFREALLRLLCEEGGEFQCPLSLLKISTGLRKASAFSRSGRTVTVMVPILFAVLSILVFRFRSRAALELKVVALQHQLTVLRRQRPRRPQLSPLAVAITASRTTQDQCRNS